MAETSETFARMSIFDVMITVFPDGTRSVDSDSKDIDDSWRHPPVLAADNFAFAGYLIQVAGLMGFFEPNPNGPTSSNRTGFPRIILTTKEREKCLAASRKWQSLSPVVEDKTYKLPPLMHKCWSILFNSRHDTVNAARYHAGANPKKPKTPPDWWKAVFMLLIVADEACDGIGHYFPNKKRGKYNLDMMVIANRLDDGKNVRKSDKRDYKERKQVATLGWRANRHVVSVQPKGRVAQVGCSLRHLSRNLAIVGPSGNVRCHWQQLAGDPNDECLRDCLNILVIPLPLELAARDFRGTEVQPGYSPEKKGWGEFEIDQNWLPRNKTTLVSDILNLIEAAKKDVACIDAIVFPEYALKYDIIRELLDTVSTDPDLQNEIKFIVSGSSDNCEKQQHNCVITAVRESLLIAENNATDDRATIVSQAKHHRWKLSEDQISSYGLGSALSPSVNWWENHEIGKRDLHIHQLRRDTIFAALVCEDLARNDPVHDIMRSVAPNLLFALLMDGPQLPSRWPARYAATLADDPGTTVVTLTSNGLVERSNNQFSDKKSHSVGLIRDGRGVTKEIQLPDKHQAVVLTLGSENITDYTIDGRPTTNASEWFYISQRPIKSSKVQWTS